MDINRCYGCEYYDGRKNDEDVLCSLGINAKFSIGCSSFSPDKAANCLRNCAYAQDYKCTKGNPRSVTNSNIEYCYDYARKEYKYNTSSKSSKKGCFVTTAICEIIGKEDNCYELEVLRNFRDKKLLKDKSYVSMVDEYYQISPLLIKKIHSQKNKIEFCYYLLNNFINPMINNINENKTTDAIENYKTMITFIKEL